MTAPKAARPAPVDPTELAPNEDPTARTFTIGQVLSIAATRTTRRRPDRRPTMGNGWGNPLLVAAFVLVLAIAFAIICAGVASIRKGGRDG
jgi:hypothetical protein